MKILIALAATLIAVPAMAQETTVEVVNQSSLTVSAISGFPLDEAGDFIEDNLGGFFDDLLPGQTRIARFSGRCGPMLAVVMLGNGGELRTNLDTCKDHTIVVSDQPAKAE